MIAIAAPVFDISGAMIFKNSHGSDIDSISRRTSRTATLDGGAYISDAGYTDADITLTVDVSGLTALDVVNIKRLVTSYTTLVASTSRAVYTVSPTSFNYRSGIGSLVLFVKTKISG